MWTRPSDLPARASDMRGGDILAEIALRACDLLLDSLSAAKRERTGLVIGTELGCLEMDRVFDRSRRDHGGRYASPAAFSRTLPSTMAAELALKFALRSPSLVVSGGLASTGIALRRAARWMVHCDLDYCISGGMEWNEGESCRVGLLLLSWETSGVGILRFSEGWNGQGKGLEGLMAWVGGEERVMVGAGVELVSRAQE